MLELRHVSKIYRTGAAMQVKALDDISLTFGETRLVFLLGKSGSGKSTLLNVAGGLDEATTGEIVVMGKSSNDFSGSDFDSYRNTYVGFVFQEYNVLQEFNVEDNIALALELQGKTKERDRRVQEILREVDLVGLEKRRPNTLSGGQKQRIAIARALVKDPQIIMADEPTGALDSATGRQILDTLKKLSASRLVIVVSHDREAAEAYGDRIIELKDGKVVSDVEKHAEPPAIVSENITRIGENTLSVKRCAALTDEDMERLRSFMTASEGAVILSRGKGEIAAFRKANRIGADDSMDRFLPTAAQEQKKDKTCRFIRSRLPLGRAMRIGASGLKIKPFRLVMTILLSCISFVMFGLASTLMLYDPVAVLSSSLLAGDDQMLSLSKYSTITLTTNATGEVTQTRGGEALFSEEEIQRLGGDRADGAYSFYGNPDNIVSSGGEGSSYYRLQFTRAVSPRAQSPLRERILAGNLPQQANELCVSSYFYEGVSRATFRLIDENGYYLTDENGSESDMTISVNSYEDLVGTRIRVQGTVFTISGIFDSGVIPEKYDHLKTLSQATSSDDYYLFQNYLADSLAMCVLVHDDFAQQYPALIPHVQNDLQLDVQFSYSYYNLAPEHENYTFATTDAFIDYATTPYPERVTFFTGDSLTGNQVALPLEYLSYFNYEENDILTEQEWNDTINLILSRDGSSQEIEEAYARLNAYYAATRPTVRFLIYDENGEERLFGSYEVVGYLKNPQLYAVCCSPEVFASLDMIPPYYTSTSNYTPSPDDEYHYLLIPFDHTASQLDPILEQLDVYSETDISYTMTNSLYSSVQQCNYLIEALFRVFLIIGCALAVFSALLLFNFISVSIAGKKREIGILRAVGARGTDVFKIFFSESGIITGICFVLSVVLTLILVFVLNGEMASVLGIPITLFVFGPMPILLVFGIALLVAIIATFLPVFFAARKRPVESIRAL